MSQRSGPIETPRRYQPEFDGLDRREIARRYGRAAAYREDAESSVAFWLRLLALLLVASLVVMLAAYTLSRVTSRDSARRILGRAIPEITDFDGTLSSHYDELQSAAASPGGANGFSLTGYPIKAVLYPKDVLNRSPSEVRQTLLTRSADAVYERGTGAFAANGRPVKLGSFGLLSAPWAFNTALDVLNPGFHSHAQSVAKAALIAVVVLGILLLPLSRGYNQLVMYGAALLIAALPVLVLAGIAWLVVQLIYGASLDPLVAGTSDLARDVCWFVVLSYLVYLGLALAIVILGLLFEWMSDAFATPADPARRSGYTAERRPDRI